MTNNSVLHSPSFPPAPLIPTKLIANVPPSTAHCTASQQEGGGPGGTPPASPAAAGRAHAHAVRHRADLGTYHSQLSAVTRRAGNQTRSAAAAEADSGRTPAAADRGTHAVQRVDSQRPPPRRRQSHRRRTGGGRSQIGAAEQQPTRDPYLAAAPQRRTQVTGREGGRMEGRPAGETRSAAVTVDACRGHEPRRPAGRRRAPPDGGHSSGALRPQTGEAANRPASR